MLSQLIVAQTECQGSCPNRGMDYRTHTNIASLSNIATWQECAALCAKITAPERCEYWSWLDSTSPVYPGYCWLKENNGEYVLCRGIYSEHCVSGSKDCHHHYERAYGLHGA